MPRKHGAVYELVDRQRQISTVKASDHRLVRIQDMLEQRFKNLTTDIII